MNTIISDYIAAADIRGNKLNAELTSRVAALYDAELANGAEEDFAAKQLLTVLGDPKDLRRAVTREHLRASGLPELGAILVIIVGLIALGVRGDAFGGFSPVAFLVILGVSAAASAIIASLAGFTLGKFLRGVQVTAFVCGLAQSGYILIVRFRDGFADPEITSNGNVVINSFIYITIIFAAASIAKCVNAHGIKARVAVESALHDRLADRML